MTGSAYGRRASEVLDIYNNVSDPRLKHQILIDWLPYSRVYVRTPETATVDQWRAVKEDLELSANEWRKAQVPSTANYDLSRK